MLRRRKERHVGHGDPGRRVAVEAAEALEGGRPLELHAARPSAKAKGGEINSYLRDVKRTSLCR